MSLTNTLADYDGKRTERLEAFLASVEARARPLLTGSRPRLARRPVQVHHCP